MKYVYIWQVGMFPSQQRVNLLRQLKYHWVPYKVNHGLSKCAINFWIIVI